MLVRARRRSSRSSALAAVDDVLGAVLLLEPLPDLLPGVGGPDDVHPVARRAVLALGRDDLDDVAVLEPVVERHEPVVDLGADRAVADVGVDPVREVERRGARRQVLDVAARREHEHLVLEDVELDALDELGRVGLADVALPLHELAQPGELRVVVALGLRALLVPPVGRDADLGHLVHRVGPDLDLERLAVERDHRGVERLVEVVLGDGDVVVELARDRAPQRVHDAQRRVAVADLVDEQADGVDVVDLAELRALALHLLPDAVDVLRAALELGLDARAARAAGAAPRSPARCSVSRPLRRVSRSLASSRNASGSSDLEAEVLELPLDLPDPEPLRERGVDLHRLAGDPLLLLGLEGTQRAHVVEPVGELDEDDADVVGHRQEHLPDVLGLLLLVAVGAELRQLGDAVDEVRDLGAEPLLDVGEAVLGVLGDVVEERGRDRDGVDAELREDLRRGDRMRDVRLARCADLRAVRLDGEVERALDRLRGRPAGGLRIAASEPRLRLAAERLEVPGRAPSRAVPAAAPSRRGPRRAARAVPAAWPSRGTSGSRTTGSAMESSLPRAVRGPVRRDGQPSRPIARSPSSCRSPSSASRARR